MNGIRGSLQPGTLLIIACVVGVFIAAAVMAFRSGRKHAKAVEEFAQARGWTYSRTDAQGLAAKVERLFPEETFSLDNIMTVESGERNVFLFDCGYNYREYRRGRRFGTACMIESDRFRSVGSPVEIIARTWVDEKLLSRQVEMGNTEFARNFIVLSKDTASAAKTVGESMQAVLVEHMKTPLYYPVRIALGTSGAVLLTGYTGERERWLDLVALARRIEATLR